MALARLGSFNSYKLVRSTPGDDTTKNYNPEPTTTTYPSTRRLDTEHSPKIQHGGCLTRRGHRTTSPRAVQREAGALFIALSFPFLFSFPLHIACSMIPHPCSDITLSSRKQMFPCSTLFGSDSASTPSLGRRASSDTGNRPATMLLRYRLWSSFSGG